MKRAFILAVAVVAALLIGCGGDDSGSDSTDSSSASSGDTGAVETTITTWLLEGDCDLMTDKFVEAQTFSEDREQGCEAFEGGFTPPIYSEDDIEITDVEITGEKATAIVGGGGVDITSKYTLVLEDGTWKIDAAEIE